MTPAEFRQTALSFNHTEEAPHFDRIAFKVTNRRIFATMLEKDLTVNMKLSPEDQEVFCSFDQTSVYPVPNKWGQQGWTTFEIDRLPGDVVEAALFAAYHGVATTKNT